MPPKKSCHDRLIGQLKVVSDKVNKGIMQTLIRNNLGPSPGDIEYKAHTVLKLAYLNYYMGIFLPIAHKHFNKIVFIDAFGGSGIVKIENSNYAVLGSTLMAATAKVSGKSFNLVISIDKDQDKSDLLRSRVQALGIKNTHIECGDTNDIIKDLAARYNLDKGTGAIFFIDPEGMEANLIQFMPLFESVKAVDLIINKTWGIQRLNGRIQKNVNEADIKAMQRMVPDYTPGDNPDEKLLNFFEDTLAKPIGDAVDIHDIGKKVAYSLILRTNRTKTNSKWTEGMKPFGHYISTLDDKSALNFLHEIFGRQDHFNV
ncbi:MULTISPECIES: three-Cys-motif partner protein TcmP [unclassified Acidiplasma]|nr:MULTISPECIES: three-Cys-motif partner protein TcmP [unclassified Acidiplasma]KJE48561.1 hypothetical protein TZ01_07795 [Acidiplasma sp. MBA-1]WMT55296.1 MAG: three-Cys-motif partner protein TcmP [Acidiplasma sp.]